jgi:hypothetical protein
MDDTAPHDVGIAGSDVEPMEASCGEASSRGERRWADLPVSLTRPLAAEGEHVPVTAKVHGAAGRSRPPSTRLPDGVTLGVVADPACDVIEAVERA